MVLTQMMPRNGSKKREPLKVIQRQKKLNLRIPFPLWKRKPTSLFQLLLRNQSTKETLIDFNAKLLLKVPTVHQPLLEKKSL